LRWFWRVERKDDNDWVTHCITGRLKELDREDARKKTWWDFVKNDMDSLAWPAPKGCAVQE